MNIDYSVCRAFRRFKGAKAGVLAYDVFCQWIIHFLERVDASGTLTLPEDFELLGGVGKFHLGAHVKDCFYQFSLNFLPYVGQIDGEIMETNWALLNRIASLIRAMSKAHRQEVLDDLMHDINWKKLIASGGPLFCREVHF
jgi:Kyakuja-Dileera-Zisupton transposase